MSDADKVAAILNSINASDSQLIILLRASVNKNLPNVTGVQLDMIMQALGLTGG